MYGNVECVGPAGDQTFGSELVATDRHGQVLEDMIQYLVKPRGRVFSWARWFLYIPVRAARPSNNRAPALI